MSAIEPNSAKLYIWPERFRKGKFEPGHAALHVMDADRKRYLSWWPASGSNPSYRPIATMSGYGLNTEGTGGKDKSKEFMGAYSGSAEKKRVFSGTLGYKAMVDWIDGLHGTTDAVLPADFQVSRWQMNKENCASVSAYALRVGVEAAKLDVPWPAPPTWLPSLVWDYATEIAKVVPANTVKRDLHVPMYQSNL